MIIYLKCYTCNKLIYIDLATPENRKELRIVKFDSGATIHITYTVKCNEKINKKRKKRKFTTFGTDIPTSELPNRGFHIRQMAVVRSTWKLSQSSTDAWAILLPAFQW